MCGRKHLPGTLCKKRGAKEEDIRADDFLNRLKHDFLVSQVRVAHHVFCSDKQNFARCFQLVHQTSQLGNRLRNQRT